MNIKLTLLSFLVLLIAFVSGCIGIKEQPQTVEPLKSIQIKLLNERVCFDIPANWQMLKKGIGIIEKEIYFVPFDDNSDPNFMGNAVAKCHYCRPELTVKVYSDTLLNNLLDESKGNELIYDENFGDTWRNVKWIGKDGEKKFIIWDKFGVEQEIALHFRVTCPVVEEKKAAMDRTEHEAMFVLKSINITEKPEQLKPETDKTVENTDAVKSIVE